MRVVDLCCFLLTLDCVRNAVAMPSVWLRRRASKWRRFNGFGFDSPLIATGSYAGILGLRRFDVRIRDHRLTGL